jgi:SAM-dependent methyltransferase
MTGRRPGPLEDIATAETFGRRHVREPNGSSVDPISRENRVAWEAASEKHVREDRELLAEARTGSSLLGLERDLLRPVLASGPEVVHLQSGHGLDDIALVGAGARSVVGVDFSAVAASAAQRRANELAVNCRYVVAALPGAPLRDASADLVYTGKGALIWMRDLTAWAGDAIRLLRPGGYLFVYEGHPATPLWSWDEDRPRLRTDRSYFGRTFVNDTFPARGAIEWQWTLGEIVTAVVAAGADILHLGEHPEPFWRMGGVAAAAWNGTLPNSFSLLARRRPPAPNIESGHSE